MCQLLICRRNTHTNTYVSKKKKTKTNTFDPISLMTPQTITHTSASNLHEKHTHNTSEKGIDIVSKIVRDRWIRGWSYQGHHFIFASIVPLGIATIWILLSTGSAAKEGRGAETITEIKTYFALRRVRTNMFIGRLVLRSISALVLKLNFEITIQL